MANKCKRWYVTHSHYVTINHYYPYTETSIIYGGITPEDTYYPPSGFCFDILCENDNIIDDANEDEYNVVTKVSYNFLTNSQSKFPFITGFRFCQ